MSNVVISVENLSKEYRLGQIGTGTLTNDLKVWWAKTRGKPNPMLKIGQADHGNRDGETIFALKDVSFTVNQGDVLGIIGRNGAGKSTLLKILSRVTAPTSGRVKVKGRIASLLEVGTGFHPDLTGRENTYLNGAILGMTRQEVRQKFDEILDFAEIEKFIDTPVKRYSSGMFVRLAFAVAAHLDPEILLVDEVLAVGDIEFQKKCLGKMKTLGGEGHAIIFVSHNLAAINSLTERCILISEGKTILDGSTKTVTTQYLQFYEASQDLQNGIKDASGIITVTECNVTNSGSSNSDLIDSRKPIRIESVVAFDQEIRDVSFYIQILDLYDNIIYTGLSSDSGNWLPIVKGEYHIEHEFSLPLVPGKYFISFGIVNIHHRYNPIGNFRNIKSFNVDFQETWMFDKRNGYFYPQGIWDISDSQHTIGKF